MVRIVSIAEHFMCVCLSVNQMSLSVLSFVKVCFQLKIQFMKICFHVVR